jgi:hypothetical protein
MLFVSSFKYNRRSQDHAMALLIDCSADSIEAGDIADGI